jgi:hypothetical protein
LFETDKDYLSKYIEGDYDPEETDSSDTEKGLRRYFMPIYIPDIIVEYSTSGPKNKKVAAVIDAKYSDVEEKWKEKRARTHQIMFYMQAIKCNIAGLIGMAESEESDGFSGLKDIYHNAISPPRKSDDNTNGKKLCFIPITYEKNKKSVDKADDYEKTQKPVDKAGNQETVVPKSVREFLESLLKEITKWEERENEKRELISKLDNWRSVFSKQLDGSRICEKTRQESTDKEEILRKTIRLIEEDKL